MHLNRNIYCSHYYEALTDKVKGYSFEEYNISGGLLNAMHKIIKAE